MSSESKKYTLSYFQPGQISFVVAHPGLLELDDSHIASLISKSEKALKGIGVENGHIQLKDGASGYRSGSWISSLLAWLLRLFFRIFDPGKVLAQNYIRKFGAIDKKKSYKSKIENSKSSPKIQSKENSSILFANIIGLGDDPLEFFQKMVKFEVEMLKQPDLGNGAQVLATPLNWLVSGMPGQSGTGGPGSWPVPYRGAPELAPYEINLPAGLHASKSKGENVEVFILDTMPCQSELTTAYNAWKDKHPLIHSLLRPNGLLELHPMNAVDQHRLRDLQTFGHDYKMTDHGLFAAGLIHSIVPCAKIHLVEVLNHYGVGDTDSILNGLKIAIDCMDKKPDISFVVNCSFTCNLPLTTEHCITLETDARGCFSDLFTQFDRDLEREIIEQIKNDPKWIEKQRLALEHSCDEIFDSRSRVIAAAGNDRKPNQASAPQARYPAAFGTVQGVGALPKEPLLTSVGKRESSSYSNLADIPSSVGIMTLGGEGGEGQGVLGMYLGEFPGGEANRSKWAWWAGTSFATPIASAVIALQQSELHKPNSVAHHTQEAIDRLHVAGTIKNGLGEGNTDVLDVTQGYS